MDFRLLSAQFDLQNIASSPKQIPPTWKHAPIEHLSLNIENRGGSKPPTVLELVERRLLAFPSPPTAKKGTGFPTPFPATAVLASLGKVVSRSSPKRRSLSQGFFGHRRIGSGFPSTSPVTAKTAVEVQIHFRSSPGWQGLPKRFSGFGAPSADLRVLGGCPWVHRRGHGGPQSRKTHGRRAPNVLWGSSPVWQASGN